VLACERISTKTHSTESRCIKTGKYTVCRCVCVCTFQPRNLTGWAVKGLTVITPLSAAQGCLRLNNHCHTSVSILNLFSSVKSYSCQIYKLPMVCAFLRQLQNHLTHYCFCFLYIISAWNLTLLFSLSKEMLYSPTQGIRKPVKCAPKPQDPWAPPFCDPLLREKTKMIQVQIQLQR